MTSQSPHVVRVALGGLLLGTLAAAVLTGRHVPPGVAIHGAVVGVLYGLIAAGLVVTYRVSRVINFAQLSLGAAPAVLALTLFARRGWPYPAALFVMVALSLLLGGAVEHTVVQPFRHRSKLGLAVALIGVAQGLGAVEAFIPKWVSGALLPSADVRSPFGGVGIRMGGFRVTGDHLVASMASVGVIVALVFLLGRSSYARYIGATSENPERAELLGVPVRWISRAAWMVAGFLSGTATFLRGSLLGLPVGRLSDPVVFLYPLAAAVLTGFDNIAWAVGASVVLGIADQASVIATGSPALVDLAVLAVLVLALLSSAGPAQQQQELASQGNIWTPGSSTAIDAAVVSLERVRAGVIAVALVAAGAATVLLGADVVGFIAVECIVLVLAVVGTELWPAQAADIGPSRWRRTFQHRFVRGSLPIALTLTAALLLVRAHHADAVALLAIEAIIAVSLVVLSGWSGEISFGQFAIAGSGAAAAGGLGARHGADFFVSLAAAAGAGAAVSVVVGIPALRRRAVATPVTTLALAIAAPSFMLSHRWMGWLLPAPGDVVVRPRLYGWLDIGGDLTFGAVCLVTLAIVLAAAASLRASHGGRSIIALRDNTVASEAIGLAGVRIRLAVSLFSGVVAGLGGGLYAYWSGSVDAASFRPEESITVLAFVAIAGITSLPGALVAGAAVAVTHTVVPLNWALLIEGAGLVVVLLAMPGGASDVGKRGLAAITFLHRRASPPKIALVSHGPASGLTVRELAAAYAGSSILSDVTLDVAPGELVRLVGANGAGKTTLLSAVAGLVPAARGVAYVDGEATTGPARAAALGLAYVPATPGVFRNLSVFDNLLVAAGSHASASATAGDALRQFPVLRGMRQQLAGTLSVGEQRVLAFSMAVLRRPSVLLLDEPFLGVRGENFDAMANVLEELKLRGTAIICAEHEESLGAALADRTLVVQDGRISTVYDPRPATLAVGRTEPGVAPPLDTPVLIVNGLVRRFGSFPAVDGLSFAVGAGCTLAVTGPNGAGKTTLLDLVAGSTPVSAGTILFRGSDITQWSAQQRAVAGICRGFQIPQLFGSLTARETIAVALHRHLRASTVLSGAVRLPEAQREERWTERRTSEIIELVGLSAEAEKEASALSTGQRRLLEFAVVVAQDPAVLLLDEPSAGLSPEARRAFVSLVQATQAEQRFALVIVEHDRDVIAALADHTLELAKGAMVTRGHAKSAPEHDR